MRRLLFGVATALCMTLAGASVALATPTTCEQVTAGIEAVKNATTFEEVDAAMVSAGYNSVPVEVLKEAFKNDVEVAKMMATMSLESWRPGLCQ